MKPLRVAITQSQARSGDLRNESVSEALRIDTDIGADDEVFERRLGVGMLRTALALSLATVALVPEVVLAAASCATCSKEVALSRSEVQCVVDRVNKQLMNSLDPIVVATSGCKEKVKDGTRLEAVRQRGGPSSKDKSQGGGPYLLTKADARCLLVKLKSFDRKDKILRFDLRTCG